MRLALVLALTAAPAMADPLGLVDYDALFDAYPEYVETNAVGSRLLTLPGGEFVVMAEDGDYHGMDPDGIVGCAVPMLVALLALERQCPGVIPGPAIERIETALPDVLGVYVAGILPEPADPERARARFEERVDFYATRMERTGALCPYDNPAMPEMVGMFASERFLDPFSDGGIAPRLPVAAACPATPE
ncbi:hypothetical protein HKCCE2091_00785 [Rhodobacterales bacterium HKCCE2091]|nr:hypothetical protein [Rhodobacterales bacterium HKCCE2091]